MKICHACRKEITIEKKIGRRDVCPMCLADLHCCLNCAFHSISAPKQCLEPVAELVKDKNKGNFCDYFVFVELGPSRPTATEAEKARKALSDLFKK
jgi:hypothetical protein